MIDGDDELAQAPEAAPTSKQAEEDTDDDAIAEADPSKRYCR